MFRLQANSKHFYQQSQCGEPLPSEMLHFQLEQMTDVNVLTCRETLTISSPVETRSAFSLRKEFLMTKVSSVESLFNLSVTFYKFRIHMGAVSP